VVSSLNGDSASGPDDFLGQFLQCCWNIVKEDISNMVRAFFCGHELPRFITHTNLILILILILIPKKEVVDDFGDLRPINLSTLNNKIISRLIHERLAPVLPDIISQNQEGFVKGRSITEKCPFGSRDYINRRNKFHNVVVKLDMAKAYDRVTWIFLTKVLRSFGFSERIVDMVVRLVSNNWYPVNMNGKTFGFFHSTRGVKQGDPLSPTLFIIAAEVLARNLNHLFMDQDFKGFGVPKWSPEINHMSYANDTILFCSGQPSSMKKMMKVLRGYEKVSGQMVNLDKSLVYLHEKVSIGICSKIRRITGIKQGSFPFTYLGCPIFYGRKNISHF